MCGPGDPEGFLYRGRLQPDGTRDGDQMALIEKLAGTGANCIYLMAVRSHGGDGDATHNPFTGHDPSRGLNPAALGQWETWFEKMDANGIVIYFFFYDDSASIWNTGGLVGNAERRFIHGLVDRFKHHKNLIWCIAEEYQERLSVERVKTIAAEIRAVDDHRHAIAVHKLHGLDFSELADDPTIDQFAIQYNVPTAPELHAGLVQAWHDADGRYSLNMSEAAGHGTGREARLKNWACAMAGAYVMILEMDIETTPTADLEDCGRLVRFFESTRFNEVNPRDDLAYAETDYVLAKPSECYIAYASDCQGTIGIKNLQSGAYSLHWFDCVTGKIVTEEHRIVDGDRSWKRPAGIGEEVAVYVERHP